MFDRKANGTIFTVPEADSDAVRWMRMAANETVPMEGCQVHRVIRENYNHVRRAENRPSVNAVRGAYMPPPVVRVASSVREPFALSSDAHTSAHTHTHTRARAAVVVFELS